MCLSPSSHLSWAAAQPCSLRLEAQRSCSDKASTRNEKVLRQESLTLCDQGGEDWTGTETEPGELAGSLWSLWQSRERERRSPSGGRAVPKLLSALGVYRQIPCGAIHSQMSEAQVEGGL